MNHRHCACLLLLHVLGWPVKNHLRKRGGESAILTHVRASVRESDEGSVVHWSQQVAVISECKMCLASFLLSVSSLVSLVMKCTIIFAEMSQSVHILIANQVCLGTGSLAFDICGVHLTGPEKFFNDTRRSSHNRLNHSSLLNHLFPNLFSRWYWSFRFKTHVHCPKAFEVSWMCACSLVDSILYDIICFWINFKHKIWSKIWPTRDTVWKICVHKCLT